MLLSGEPLNVPEGPIHIIQPLILSAILRPKKGSKGKFGGCVTSETSIYQKMKVSIVMEVPQNSGLQWNVLLKWMIRTYPHENPKC